MSYLEYQLSCISYAVVYIDLHNLGFKLQLCKSATSKDLMHEPLLIILGVYSTLLYSSTLLL